MYRLKNYIVAVCVMIITTMVSLMGVSTLTYLFKWQADKAMIGIIVTYILAGLVGGFVFKRLGKTQNRDERKLGVGRKAIEALSLNSIFMLLLIFVSVFVLQNPFEISERILMIWGIMTSSCFLGRIL